MWNANIKTQGKNTKTDRISGQNIGNTLNMKSII